MERQYALQVAREDRGYRATMLGAAGIAGYGSTRAAAIREAEAALHEAVAQGEIVSVTVDVPERDPWQEYSGMWKDMPDEDWAAYQQAIEEHRRELAEDEEGMP